MRLQETKEPRPLGKAGEQRPIVARQPVREGTIPDPFERMQPSQGDHLTGPEEGRRMCGDGAHLFIDLVESRVINATVVLRLSSQGKDVTPTSVEASSDDCQPTHVHHESLEFSTHYSTRSD